MKTVLQTIQSGTPYLEKAGVDAPRLNMEHLLAHVMGCKRMDLYLRFNEPLEEKTLEPLRNLTRRRAKREPLQHLLGTVEFLGRSFKTDSRALIPRPETEELAEWILQWELLADLAILDMGCGSGLSGKVLEEAGHYWVGCDVSRSMLDVASEPVVALSAETGTVALTSAQPSKAEFYIAALMKKSKESLTQNPHYKKEESQ